MSTRQFTAPSRLTWRFQEVQRSVHTAVETLNDKRSNIRGNLLRSSLITAQKGIKVCQDRDRLWWRHTYTETHEVNGPRSSLEGLSVRQLQFLPLLPMVSSGSTTLTSVLRGTCAAEPCWNSRYLSVAKCDSDSDRSDEEFFMMDWHRSHGKETRSKPWINFNVQPEGE